MLAAVQGIIRDNMIHIDKNELKPFNGRTVTVIINEDTASKPSKQDKTKFFAAVGKIDIDSSAANELRTASMI